MKALSFNYRIRGASANQGKSRKTARREPRLFPRFMHIPRLKAAKVRFKHGQLVIFRWGNRIGFSMKDSYPNWAQHTEHLLNRSAVRRALAREGISVWE